MFNPKQRDSESSTDIDRQNQRVRHEKSEWGALVRGSDPPSGHSVHNTAGDRWRAPARRLLPKQLAGGVYKADDKNCRSSSMAKNSNFFQVWEKSVGRPGQPLAS